LVNALVNYQEKLKKFDHNADGKVNIADMTTLIDKILSGDDDVKVSDLTDLINYLLSAENNIKEYDIDGNGEFNTDDVKALINQILNA
jgi:Ca2+-binding EF-hand superfamily protein